MLYHQLLVKKVVLDLGLCQLLLVNVDAFLVQKRHLKLEPFDLILLRDQRSIVLFWHLDGEHLGIRNSHNPDLVNNVSVAVLEIQYRCPLLV